MFSVRQSIIHSQTIAQTATPDQKLNQCSYGVCECLCVCIMCGGVGVGVF